MNIDDAIALKEHQEIEDIYGDIVKDLDRKREQLLDPLEAIKFIHEQLNIDPEDNEHIPVLVLEVEEVVYNEFMTSTDIKVIAKVQCDDDAIRRVTVEWSYWGGNRNSPPETDGNVEWENIVDA